MFLLGSIIQTDSMLLIALSIQNSSIIEMFSIHRNVKAKLNVSLVLMNDLKRIECQRNKADCLRLNSIGLQSDKILWHLR